MFLVKREKKILREDVKLIKEPWFKEPRFWLKTPKLFATKKNEGVVASNPLHWPGLKQHKREPLTGTQ